MEKLRFPIGQYSPPEKITMEHIAKWIDELENFADLLRTEISGLSDEQLDTPYRAEGWTIRQVVHHLPDSHVNSYTRFRLALTENVPTIKTYNEALFAELPDAKTAPVDLSLNLLDALHKRWAALLRSMSEADFKKEYIHPEFEERIVLGWNIGLYAWHCRHHMMQIRALKKRKGWA
ncbi:MAG TPA: putative metal-dependent hydrolase [Saprospiraceae bacterium]|nr:putative metal-dependent hydrolase [Saprospiraceae bacterium]